METKKLLVVEPKLPEVPIPDAEYWEPVLKAFENLEGEDFTELMHHFQAAVSDSRYADLHALVSSKGWYESIAQGFESDFHCPGDGDWLRDRIRKSAGAALYFYADGSVLLETDDELSVWRGSPDEIELATSGATAA